MTRSPFPNSPYSGASFKAALDGKFKQLYDAAAFRLTDVAGTANAVTANLTPALDGDGLIDGMGFYISWTATNTGAMTLSLNGGAPAPVVMSDGLTMLPSAVESGLVSHLVYWGGNFIMMSPPLVDASSGGAFYWAFTASGTWTKPADLAADRLVIIEMWGGGGAGGIGATGGGGGGGSYVRRIRRAAELGSTVTVTVGPGGSNGQSGGNTVFGGNAAYGGGGGGGANLVAGGGGGGSGEKGANAFLDGSDQTGGAGGFLGGGRGADPDVALPDATTPGGGGGGGGGSNFNSVSGGRAEYGGGGGGGRSSSSSNAPGGVSLFGGNGGAGGAAGVAPGGGGGGGGASGARGEVRVWIP